MEPSEGDTVDITVKQLLETVKKLHDNTVVSLKREITSLQSELIELKSEQNGLKRQFGILEEEKRRLTQKLSVELDKKKLMQQLFDVLSTTGPNAKDPSVLAFDTPESAQGNLLWIDHEISDINLNADTATALASEATSLGIVYSHNKTALSGKNLHGEGNLNDQCVGGNANYTRTTTHRMCSTESISNPGDVVVVNGLPGVTLPVGSSIKTTVDGSTSPLAHLLELVSSTHQLTVTPLRQDLVTARREIDELKSARGDIKLKIKCLCLEKEKVSQRLEIECKNNKRLKRMFGIVAQRITSESTEKVKDHQRKLERQLHLVSEDDNTGVSNTFRIPSSNHEILTVVEKPDSILASDQSNSGNDEVIIEFECNKGPEDGDTVGPLISSNNDVVITRYEQRSLDTSKRPSQSLQCDNPQASSCSSGTSFGEYPLSGEANPVVTVNDQKRCQCKLCGLTFQDYDALLKHKRSHRSVENVCRLCKRPFSSSTALKIHMRRHTGERPYMCQECGKSFAQAISLRIHLRKHTGERPHKCFDCGREFHDPCYFKKHQRKHLENRAKKPQVE